MRYPCVNPLLLSKYFLVVRSPNTSWILSRLVTLCLNKIKEKNWATEEEITSINQRVKDLVAECVKFAEESDFPDASELYQGIYAQEDYPFIKN